MASRGRECIATDNGRDRVLMGSALCIHTCERELPLLGASIAYNPFKLVLFVINSILSSINVVRSFLHFGYEVSFEALDKGAIEILGPFGISYTFRRLAERISQLQSGFVFSDISLKEIQRIVQDC
ncbi:hypothetical protein M9H77_23630 [Catharanthus roseus]|uniref:Uncharacterized protein n=1 Tax=Catharanthus roseus TaxID=4058 RepID=A0ACC0AWD3_CATRO|nr:hypothetical protein M9H77_23630 [Catharanthus roseus]